MNALIYGIFLQWKLDIRSKNMLITCYLVPLLFFAVMGGIFTSIMPETKDTLIPAMTVFGVSMGSLIGLPPSLAEIYGSSIQNVYKANQVPIWLGAVLTNLSAAIHLFLMSLILYAAAPTLFDAAFPEHPLEYFGGLVVFILSSLALASVAGILVKDLSKLSCVSILLFLPSILFSGIMFPLRLLPSVFQTVGKLFPATWGYELMSGCSFALIALLLIFFAASALCALAIKQKR